MAILSMTSAYAVSPHCGALTQGDAADLGDASVPPAVDRAVTAWTRGQRAEETLSTFPLDKFPSQDNQACTVKRVDFDDTRSVLSVGWQCPSRNGRPISRPYAFMVCEVKEVQVAKRSVFARTVLSDDWVATDRRAVGFKRQAEDFKKITSAYRTRRFVREGEVLDRAVIEPVPLVARNEQVSVHVQSSDVAVDLPGVALMDGMAGDTVRVRNTTNGEVFEATVDGPGSATLTVR